MLLYQGQEAYENCWKSEEFLCQTHCFGDIRKRKAC